MSHSNISIFVPHLGCPHQCSFCNQKHITGCSTLPSADDVHDAVNTAIHSKNYDSQGTEIAFFGGSFTAIETEYMLELLTAANKYVKNGQVKGIRVSTRPDCINEQILQLLKNYSVTAIELGAQSMVDSVLSANNRGHRSCDVKKASKLIKSYGFSLGLQMMTGLYCSHVSDDIKTAEELIKLKPDTVRIYPTITLKNTYLERLYANGDYIPPSLESTVSLVSTIEDMFASEGIKVIRIGLHSIDENSYVAGPWHPAFGELCQSYKFRQKIQNAIPKSGRYVIYANGSDISKIVGHNRSNILYFEKKNIILKIISDNSIEKSHFVVEEVN